VLKVLPSKDDLKYFSNTPFKKIPLKKHILLRNINFSYKKHSGLLKDINLKILKGSFVGIVGKSGCGKSTLADIIMGIHRPNNGFLEVDGRLITGQNIASWRLNIASVPQNVFVLNTSYLENIAFGIPVEKINKNLVIKSAKKAKIHDFINSLPNKYNEVTGERGNLLSGGQKQRLAIARAFYKKAQILILDEATNALDMNTESEILVLIKSLGPTITTIMISHNIESLKHCSCIYKIENEKIYKI
jgi:ATP-binding cassette subfamily B protein